MTNIHCNVISIEDKGILIQGTSGSGKTSLALGLLERAEAQNLRAVFITDDQAILENANGTLLATAPAAIAGKVEIRGFGISELDHEASVKIALVAHLVPDEQIERIPEPGNIILHGIEIPLLHVPQRHEEQAARIVLAWIRNGSS